MYDLITGGCQHLYSKNNLQVDKFNSIIPLFTSLSKKDPYFLAHLTAWSNKKDSKDLKVLSIYFNFLNDADGTPFFVGSKKNKPNLRLVSSSLLQNQSPHIALRILELSRIKFEVKNHLSLGAHYPSTMKTAFRKYMLYRESNLEMVRGIKNGAMAKKYVRMYKLMHMAPTIEVASILNWKQRGRKLSGVDRIDFTDMLSKDIAETIITRKLSPLVALPAIPTDKMNSTVAKSLLKNCTGNQAVILQNAFRNRGFLDIPEINTLFLKKVAKADTAVDRIDTLSKDLTEEEKKVMSKVRSEKRKEQTGKIGKVFVHIDNSPSMHDAIEFAKDRGSVIAECVNDPKKNFSWGTFNDLGRMLKTPDEFTKEDFHAGLYGIGVNGYGTNCLALYEESRKRGTDVDIFLTDGGHNNHNFNSNTIKTLNEKYGAPKAVVIVKMGSYSRALKNMFEEAGVPVAEIESNTLKESAMVAQSVAAAVKGRSAIIEEIMDTLLPEVPRWFYDTSLEKVYMERLNA